jgi:hypothetical protein
MQQNQHKSTFRSPSLPRGPGSIVNDLNKIVTSFQCRMLVGRPMRESGVYEVRNQVKVGHIAALPLGQYCSIGVVYSSLPCHLTPSASSVAVLPDTVRCNHGSLLGSSVYCIAQKALKNHAPALSIFVCNN